MCKCMQHFLYFSSGDEDMPPQNHRSDSMLAGVVVPETAHAKISSTIKFRIYDPNDIHQGYDYSKTVSQVKTYLAGMVNVCVLLPIIAALLTIFSYFLLPTIPWIPN